MSKLDAIIKEFAHRIAESAREEALEPLRAVLGARGPAAANGAAKPAQARPAAPRKSPMAQPKRPAAKKSNGGQRDRRSPAELAEMQHKILTYIKANPGKRSEDIRAALKLSKKDWQLPAQQLVASKQIVASGERRATTYRAK